MKEYPVGSLCMYRTDMGLHPDYAGRECTIVEGLKDRMTHSAFTGEQGMLLSYIVHVEGHVNHAAAVHDTLILKKFPPHLDQWCNETMLKVLKPVEIKDEEIVK